jgi:hypothetical protein
MDGLCKSTKKSKSEHFHENVPLPVTTEHHHRASPPSITTEHHHRASPPSTPDDLGHPAVCDFNKLLES